MAAFVVLKTSFAEGFWGHPLKDPIKRKKVCDASPIAYNKMNASKMGLFVILNKTTAATTTRKQEQQQQ